MFTPKISISVPNTSTSVTITDITGTYPTDSTGYGQGSGSPASNAVWNKLVYALFLGDSPTKLNFLPYTTNIDVSASLVGDFKDGIWLFTQYFCEEVENLTYTLNTAKTVMTKGDGDVWDSSSTGSIFSGVYGLIYNGSSTEPSVIDNISVINSLTNPSITLSSALTGASANSNVWRVYRVQKYVLIMNEAESKLIADIGDMSLNALHCGVGCDAEKASKLWNRMLLKYSAQINMSCGNYIKAHNAAVLFAQTCSDPNPNCTSCE
jgi:hypothetical protein